MNATPTVNEPRERQVATLVMACLGMFVDGLMSRPLALITGASSGIGAAYARLLADDHDLVLVARRADRLSEPADELRTTGAAVEVLPADLGTPEGIAAVTKRLAAGDVRLLISNAGAGGYAPLVDVAPDEIDRLLTLNAVAPVQLARAALPGMLAADDGAVVTVASLLAFSAGQVDPHMPSRTLYAAAKAATVAFTRTLAHEVADTGVRAQVGSAPGWWRPTSTTEPAVAFPSP
ncbi:SDR family NAD(P)-dependent oxidoreductase [Streptomyces aurantiogriseus]|uniref:Short-chain dehydrogenase n=1 Tax=Streptomyces aurantiogriseus TaxID=66870 RepID=A0A918FEE0_9ACTN|nr:SDR family NAD(P)-dependent oxidoreductase [Streptomyces aurantiogriseus]GGR33377.1 hypothetical protein GCM10010251_57050 [Streptomyces aurantiogriseus]